MLTYELHKDKAACEAEAQELKTYLTDTSAEELRAITRDILRNGTNPISLGLAQIICEAVREHGKSEAAAKMPDGFLLAHMMISIMDYLNIIYKKGGGEELSAYLLSAVVAISDVPTDYVVRSLTILSVSRAMGELGDKSPEDIIEEAMAKMRAMR